MKDITWLLSRMGRALLWLAGIRIFTVALPARLHEPQWWLQMARELINISPVLLTGTTVLLVVSRIANRDKPGALKQWAWERQLLRWAAYLYALLIPVQLGATMVFDRALDVRQGQQLQAVQRQVMVVRDSPQGIVRNLRFQQLQVMEANLLAQSRQRNQRRFSLGMESLRVCGSAAAMVWLLLVAFRRQAW